MENPTLGLFLIISCLFLATPTASSHSDDDEWLQTICHRNKPITKLHFYVHDVRAGANATLYTVATASITDTSPTRFGRINVFDDSVTARPYLATTEVARAQGLTTSSDLRVQAFTMNINFVVTWGPYKGSVISLVGRNPFADEERELSVVGGSGAFRYASGYAITKTYSHDEATNYSILEYTINLTYPRGSSCSIESS